MLRLRSIQSSERTATRFVPSKFGDRLHGAASATRHACAIQAIIPMFDFRLDTTVRGRHGPVAGSGKTMTIESFRSAARGMHSLTWNEPVAAAKALIRSFFRIEVSTGDHDHVHSARWANLALLLGRHASSEN